MRSSACGSLKRLSPVLCAVPLVGLLMTAPAGAMDAIPGEQQFAGVLNPPNQMGANVGFAKINQDYFLQLVAHTELNLGPVGLGLQIPLNLRLTHNPPQPAGADYYGLIRRQDWDEPQKWLRVLRYVRLGHKRDAFYLRAGELAADVGHGTIMGRYLNNLDINSFRVGSQFDVNTPYGGVETVVGDVGALVAQGPNSRIVGGRLYFKPYSLVDPDSFLNIFAVGASAISDTNAPAQLTLGQNGNPKVDANNNLEVSQSQPATVYGFDVEAEVLHNALLDLIPYSDLNFFVGGGWGWHLGVLATARLPVGFELTLPVRLEYRRFASNYAPMYFSTFYELERFSYPLGGAGLTLPKATTLRLDPGKRGINGYYADAALNFLGLVMIGAVYEAFDGGDPNVAAFVSIPALQTIQFKAFYARAHLHGVNDIFALDDRSLLVAQARYQLVSVVYLVARWSRRWAVSADGLYKPADDWQFGLETSFTF